MKVRSPGLVEWHELFTVTFGHSRDALFAVRKKMDFDLPPIARALASLDEARGLASRHQRDDAVMNSLQALRQLRDSRPMTPRHALDMQQQQILNGGDVLRAQYRFGDVQKAPKLIAEFG